MLIKLLLVIAILGIGLLISTILSKNYIDRGTVPMMITLTACFIVTVIPSRYFHSSDYNKSEELFKEAEVLSEKVEDSKTVNGGVTQALYNSVTAHNEKVRAADMSFKWYDFALYKESNYTVDVSDCPVLTENPLLQPVYVVGNPHSETTTVTEIEPVTTSEPVTTASVTSEAVVEGEVVMIDGKYYKVVPIG